MRRPSPIGADAAANRFWREKRPKKHPIWQPWHASTQIRSKSGANRDQN
jgi:hypothetical protein